MYDVVTVRMYPADTIKPEHPLLRSINNSFVAIVSYTHLKEIQFVGYRNFHGEND